MKVLIFGATGMVGQGVLRECLQAGDVELVQTVGRTPTAGQHPKLRELVHADLWQLERVAAELTGFDACFFSIGVASAGMDEKKYIHLTYDMTLAVAETLARLNPRMVFIYVSGVGADSSETSRTMWERVRGRTENALLRLPLRGVYILRPGMIRPRDGIESKTTAYRMFYKLVKPLLPLLHRAFPRQVIDTRELGQAMLALTRYGAAQRIFETGAIGALGRKARP